MTEKEREDSIIVLKKLEKKYYDDLDAWNAIQNSIVALNVMDTYEPPEAEGLVKCRNCSSCRPLMRGWFCFAKREYVSTHEEIDKCERKCEMFKNKHIVYPIEVYNIKFPKSLGVKKSLGHETGALVKVRPCGKEYEDRTYLGILIGDIGVTPGCNYNRKEKHLEFFMIDNPAIYVPELKKVIFGCESWWSEIESEDDLKDITDTQIGDVWYVKLLREMLKPENNAASGPYPAKYVKKRNNYPLTLKKKYEVYIQDDKWVKVVEDDEGGSFLARRDCFDIKTDSPTETPPS